jgi:hypothetical protein
MSAGHCRSTRTPRGPPPQPHALPEAAGSQGEAHAEVAWQARTGVMGGGSAPRCRWRRSFWSTWPAHRRDQLARVMRYTARGAMALERLGEEVPGDRMDTCARRWSDGTTGITLAPVELVEKLAAIVPLPVPSLIGSERKSSMPPFHFLKCHLLFQKLNAGGFIEDGSLSAGRSRSSAGSQ